MTTHTLKVLSRWPSVPLFLAVACVYATTAHWSIVGVDAFSAALPAWHMATTGNAHLDSWYQWPGWPKVTPHGWLVAGAGGHWVSNRMPGVILLALPAYWLFDRGGQAPSLFPGVLTSLVCAAAAIAVLHRVLRELAPARLALAAALVAAFATPTWTVSASELWPHAPDMLLLAGVMLALSNRRDWSAGVLLGLGVLTRPYLAVAAATLGIGLSLSRRDWRPAFRIGAGSCLGLAALLAWNNHFFGHSSVKGGYGGYATSVAGVGHHQLLFNLAGVLVSPSHGIFVYSAFLLPLVPLLWRGWRSSADWIRISALAGVVGLAVELHQNSYNGGTAFYGYRVPLECLTLCAPLLLATYQTAGPVARRATRALAVVSTSLMALGAFLFPYPGYPGVDDFLRWEPGYVLASYPTRGWAVVIGVGAAAAIVARILAQRPPRMARPESVLSAAGNAEFAVRRTEPA